MFCTYLPIDVYVCTYLHSKAYTTYAYVYFTFNSQWKTLKSHFEKLHLLKKYVYLHIYSTVPRYVMPPTHLTYVNKFAFVKREVF